MYTWKYSGTCKGVCAHTSVHGHLCTHMYIDPPALIYGHICTHRHVPGYTAPHIHTYMHTDTHKYTCSKVHVCMWHTHIWWLTCTYIPHCSLRPFENSCTTVISYPHILSCVSTEISTVLCDRHVCPQNSTVLVCDHHVCPLKTALCLCVTVMHTGKVMPTLLQPLRR